MCARLIGLSFYVVTLFFTKKRRAERRRSIRPGFQRLPFDESATEGDNVGDLDFIQHQE